MRDLKRNQQTIHYSLLEISSDKDEWGNTVDVKKHGDIKELKIHVSANRGETSANAFGTDLDYDREMITHDMTCPIDEYSHLWLDGRSTTDTHNYIVKAVSKSLNNIRYAIKRVNVS